ncbi:ABC transporter permease [Thermanaeromonas sp. C210]|uniref:ABC transporter permease n=1 Tax=Thermanaeromonas sp. C210 TaxID=2731925 RepID=UPI00155BAF6A|nr:ABC transporter permease [Thermanaeromonas sp. C210]GFN24242.1 spermidine/putrescine ABC transporter permease [Thermanaeromonas sp. C210]
MDTRRGARYLWFLKQGGFRRLFVWLFITLLLISIVVPLIVMVLWSLIDPQVGWEYPDLYPKAFSLHFWRHLLSLEEVPRAMALSFTIAPVVTILTGILALPTAYVLGRKSFWGKGLIEIMVLLPIIIPGITVAISLGSIFNRLGLSQTIPGIIMAHMLVVMPYMIRTVTSTFKAIPQDVIDAAYDLGASPLQVAKYILIPLVMPGLFAGGVFTFIYSIEEFVLTFIIATPTYQTVPTLLFSYLGYYFSRPLASAISLIILVPTIFTLFLAEKFLKAEYLSSGFGKF